MKLVYSFLLIGTFLIGFAITGAFSSMAQSKYCSIGSSWTNCYNYENNGSVDYNVTRQDTAKFDGAYSIDVRDSYYSVDVYSPEQGGGSFFTGHWIYEPETGETHKNPAIDTRYLKDESFYIDNHTPVQYDPYDEPEITTKIRNGGLYEGSTYMVTGLTQ